MSTSQKDLARLAKIARFAMLAKEYEFRKAKFYIKRQRSDYPWRLLLELYIARAGGYNLPSTSLWAEAGMNATSGGRWLDFLVAEGFAYRRQVRGHNRAVHVYLTEHAVTLIEEHLLTIFGQAAKIEQECAPD